MRYPPDFVQRVREAFRVSEVVGKRIDVRRKGREFEALCPFHNEKTPSFTINDEKGFYHCFGCGAHGDTINFVKEYEGINYKEAIEKLATDAGISIPKPSPEAERQYKRSRTLIDAIEAASHWFSQQLELPTNRMALDYVQGRRLSAETINTFRIGYAPDTREGLKKHLLEQGFEANQLIEAGLIIKRDDGTTYDRFRGRVMFPIRNSSGEVVAFGGRTLSKDKNIAKYLNSPETTLFKKGEMVYNLDLARKSAYEHNQIIIAEGYMDVIALYQAGIKNAIAPLGTAVTNSQLTLCWNNVPEILLCLDGDNAGMRAMQRVSTLALPLITPEKIVRFVMLPKGEDPDTVIQNAGRAAMDTILNQAISLSDTLWQQTIQGKKLHTPEARAQIEHALSTQVKCIANPIVKQHYQSFFRQKLWQASSTKATTASRKSLHLVGGLEVKSPIKQCEAQLLNAILQAPQLLHDSSVEENLSSLLFEDLQAEQLKQAMLNKAAEEESEPANWFDAWLASSAHCELATSIIQNTHLSLPTLFATAKKLNDMDGLLAAFDHVLSGYTLTKMEQEYIQAGQAMATDMSEANLARLTELKQEIEALQLSRSKLYQENA
jgi:DNA primase